MAECPERRLFGLTRTPVLTVDAMGPDASVIRALARRLQPFPRAQNNYPGLRSILTAANAACWDYVGNLLEAASPYLAGAFDLDGFDLVEASFSLVTLPSCALSPLQRIPHFDAVDPDLFAVLHYVNPCEGTAFYRHRSTGLEVIGADDCDEFVRDAHKDAARAAPDYIRGSTDAFEQIGCVQGSMGRLVAYPARLLHSGIIPENFSGSADVRTGRLTTNIFIRGWRDTARPTDNCD